MERFWDKVKILEEDDCWEWLAFRTPKGYGMFRFRGKDWRAHRVVWTLTYGEIPKGEDVLHHCDNPPCVNPQPLFLGDQRANNLDSVSKGRWTQSRGAANGNSKLTEKDVLAIRQLHFNKVMNQKALAEMFVVNDRSISMIVNRKTWRHI